MEMFLTPKWKDLRFPLGPKGHKDETFMQGINPVATLFVRSVFCFSSVQTLLQRESAISAESCQSLVNRAAVC